MIQKKICMLGTFAVGKTSLVSRYVHSLFSERYHTTVGVKIDRKRITFETGAVDLILWDLYGDDDFQRLRTSYLRGAAGYLLVCDGTRRGTLDSARVLQATVQEELGPVPFILICNKRDLKQEWELEEEDEEGIRKLGWKVMYTSAKTGENVEAAFRNLAAAILGKDS